MSSYGFERMADGQYAVKVDEVTVETVPSAQMAVKRLSELQNENVMHGSYCPECKKFTWCDCEKVYYTALTKCECKDFEPVVGSDAE